MFFSVIILSEFVEIKIRKADLIFVICRDIIMQKANKRFLKEGGFMIVKEKVH